VVQKCLGVTPQLCPHLFHQLRTLSYGCRGCIRNGFYWVGDVKEELIWRGYRQDCIVGRRKESIYVQRGFLFGELLQGWSLS
jgi:hypothetical protein